MGHLYRRGPVWWIQFYQDGQRVRMTSESPDKDVAKRLLKEHEASVTLKEPVVVRSARVTYEELRTDLVEHYQATGARDLEEAGWRLKHLDRAFRGARANLITAGAITRYIVQRQGELKQGVRLQKPERAVSRGRPLPLGQWPGASARTRWS